MKTSIMLHVRPTVLGVYVAISDWASITEIIWTRVGDMSGIIIHNRIHATLDELFKFNVEIGRCIGRIDTKVSAEFEGGNNTSKYPA